MSERNGESRAFVPIVDANWHLTAYMERVCPQLVHGSFLWEGDNERRRQGHSAVELEAWFYRLTEGECVPHQCLAWIPGLPYVRYLQPHPFDALWLVVRLNGAPSMREAVLRDTAEAQGAEAAHAQPN